MIEIFLIARFLKSIGNLLRAKGRSPGLYQFLAVLLWVGGEITGIVIGVSANMGAGMYLLALLGAATGAGIAWMIASNVKPALPQGSELDQVFD